MIDLECNYEEQLDSEGYGDLKLSGGEPVFVESGFQHQYDLLRAGQGYYKHYPEAGVDSWNYVNDSDGLEYLRTIRKQFQADGMRVRSISYDDNGNLKIDASYETR